LALDCLEDEAVDARVLICSDSQSALNVLKESGLVSRASRVVYASNGSPLIEAFLGKRGKMKRPGRLSTLALMMVHKGGGYPLRWLRA
jgi:hypothetical protein